MADGGGTGELRRRLTQIVGAEHVLDLEPSSPYNRDAMVAGAPSGAAQLAVRPASTAEVAEVVSTLYQLEVPIVPRGGGTGLAGGAIPSQGSVVCSLERMTKVIELEPRLWRMHVQAGLTTAHVHRLARENGLLFPPDPGASEQSQIGGNVATNAGGPHAFKYGATRDWVTGLQAVIAGGEVIELGGACRKDVGGYDLRGLLIGSEGTLGLITAVRLRLIPMPAKTHAIVAFLASQERGCEAILEVLGEGILPSALDFLDRETLQIAGGGYPGEIPANASFMLLIEVDGSREQATSLRDELLQTLTPSSLRIDQPPPAQLWRWRDGVSGVVTGVKGGKVGEDVTVPPERLSELLAGFAKIAARHRLSSCAWGHGADGNVHANVLIDKAKQADKVAVAAVTDELLTLVVELGGAISGEHGLGLLKSGELSKQWGKAALHLHRQAKLAFDPKGLFNPGKKLG
jgi:glycolate oxidase subunit GlcD